MLSLCFEVTCFLEKLSIVMAKIIKEFSFTVLYISETYKCTFLVYFSIDSSFVIFFMLIAKTVL